MLHDSSDIVTILFWRAKEKLMLPAGQETVPEELEECACAANPVQLRRKSAIVVASGNDFRKGSAERLDASGSGVARRVPGTGTGSGYIRLRLAYAESN